EPGRAEPRLAELGRAEPRLAELGRAEPRLAELGRAEPRPAEPGRAEPRPAEPGRAEPRPAEPGRAEPRPAEPGRAERRPAEPRWRTVDLALRQIAARRAALDAEEARWLREAEELQIWRPLGMVSALDYLERVLGYAPRTAQERLRVARALGSLPQLG